MQLNDAQQQAVEYEGSPLIVLAGPGTGKTRVIVARIAHLIEHRRIEPEQILALTFTNKAAAELRERLGEEVGFGNAERVWASTFHSFGQRIIRRFADRLGMSRSQQIVDSSQRRALCRELAHEHGLFTNIAAGGIDSAIDDATDTVAALRHAGVSMDHAAAFVRTRLDDLAKTTDEQQTALVGSLRLFEQRVRLGDLYEQACAQRGWMSFDDLIRLPRELINRDALAADLIRTDCRCIVVDEFQDVNTAQIELLRALSPPQHMPDLCVVGDDDQSIYGFRGADDRAFARFASIWKGTQTIRLETNYRSQQAVLDAANSVISNALVRFAPDKVIDRPAEDRGEPPADGAGVELVRLEADGQSGEVIAQMILGERAETPGKPWSDYAVLVRTEAELTRVAAALELEGIPVISRRAGSPLDDAGVQDVLAWIGLLLDPTASWAARRILARPPYAIDPPRLSLLERAYRRANQQRDEQTPPEPYVAWLEAQPALGELAPGVQGMAGLLRTLSELAATRPADETIAEIIRSTDVAHADLLDGRERAGRINALVSVLRFARARSARLDEPGDLSAFWAYYERLDSKEQNFADSPDQIVEQSGYDATDPDADGVELLTAHKAKGLEFDTVFVAHVKSGRGFPYSYGSDPTELPDGLVDRVGDERTAKELRADEERRLFYVACTRAERRLVLLGRVPKKTSGPNYMIELTDAGGVSVCEAEDVFSGADRRDEIERMTLDYRGRIDARHAIESARVEARLSAAAAMGEAERDGADLPGVCAQLGSSARRLGIIAHIERAGAPPAWAAGTDLEGFAGVLADAVAAGRLPEQSEARFKPMQTPLKLSFSRINAYLQCPRCFYLRYVLGLPEAPSPSAAIGTSVHEALRRFCMQWREADSEGVAGPGLDALLALGREELNGSAATVEREQRAQAEAQLRLYFDQMHDPRAHITELELDLRFSYALGDATHTIQAKLDRVDDTPAGVRVIDYKTGHPSKKLCEPKKDDLQMGIYAMALRHHRQDADLGGVCEYWLLADGSIGTIGFDAIDEPRVRAKIDKAIEGMLGGRFEPKKGCTGPCTILSRS